MTGERAVNPAKWRTRQEWLALIAEHLRKAEVAGLVHDERGHRNSDEYRDQLIELARTALDAVEAYYAPDGWEARLRGEY